MSDEADGEIQAMAGIAKAFDGIKDDKEAVKRVLHWTLGRYGDDDFAKLAFRGAAKGRGDAGGAGGSGTGSSAGAGAKDTGEFTEVAELFDAAQPKTDWQKAVVVGHWIMTGEARSDFTGQDVNTHLKHLGHGVTNITDALSKAMKKKPALIIQTAKAGTSKQARKKYKVTRAGIIAIEKMIAGEPDADE